MQDANVLLVTTLDDIMWLTNMRGTDIENNPLFLSYAIFHREEGVINLYVDPAKVEEAKVKEHMTASKIVVKPYDSVWADLEDMSKRRLVTYDDSACNQWLGSLLNQPSSPALVIEALVM